VEGEASNWLVKADIVKACDGGKVHGRTNPIAHPVEAQDSTCELEYLIPA
jgi:hypothetical protein